MPLSPDHVQGKEARLLSAKVIKEDLSLTQRMIEGDNAAWVEFVTRFDSLIFARIRSTWHEAGLPAQSPEAAAEISAEVLAGLIHQQMKSLKSYSGRSRLSTWLSVIVRRTTLRYLCAIQKQQPDSDWAEQVDQREQNRAAQEANEERVELLRVARKKLSADDQQILQLFYEQQCSYQQIAATMQVSVNAVGPKLDRARKRLRAKTEEVESI